MTTEDFDSPRSISPNVKSRRKIIFIILAVLLIALAIVSPAIQVCRDRAFMDKNTGARKGYREWCYGGRTGFWYKQTALEMFMRTNYPSGFQQDWVSYAGTGRNIFGGAISYGHGRPGPIIHLHPEDIDRYCQKLSAADMKQLYDVLASGDKDKVNETVNHILSVDFSL